MIVPFAGGDGRPLGALTTEELNDLWTVETEAMHNLPMTQDEANEAYERREAIEAVLQERGEFERSDLTPILAANDRD